MARNRLNRGAWHGFQEVIYQEPVAAREIRFRFLPTKGGYVSLVYDHDEAGFSAIRLSASDRFPNGWMRVSHEGEFLEKQALGTEPVAAGVWHVCAWRREGKADVMTVDGEEVLRVARGWSVEG